MRIISLFAAIIALAPSVVSSQPIRCDRFEPKATLKGSQLTVSLDTDLPDWTVVMVSISRSYWAGAPTEQYPIDYVGSRSTVGEWRKAKAISVDDAVWRRKLDDQLRLLAVAGQPVKPTRLGVDITVSFTVPVFQPDPRFGPGNRNLVGTKVPSKGLRIVGGELSVKLPLGAPAQGAPVEFGDPEGLKPGTTYRLSRETPLVPERRPVDPVRAIALTRHVPTGTLIRVMTVDRSDSSHPWYRIVARTPSGSELGTGWVNSVALIGQLIKVVKP